MNDNYKYPELIIRKGIGTFCSGEIEFEVPFEITYYPQNTIIDAEVEYNIDLLKVYVTINNWKLQGIVDQNTFVSAKDLHLSKIKNCKLTFQPLNEIRFGDTSMNNFTHAEFPMVGLYNGKVELNYKNWQISSIGNDEETALKETKSKQWNLQLEGLTYRLKNNGATIEDFQSKANNITLLLSLAVGNDIIFNRQLYYKKDLLVLEIWRRKADYNFGVESCIPDFEINYYLEKSLGYFEKWSKKKKDAFYSIVNYINSSSQGFLEDRLLRLCIAWESFATRLAKEKKIINEELGPLKDFLKKSIDAFGLSGNHDKEFIKNRVLLALDWEKLNNSLINLVNQYKLDHEKLGLDFKTLIKIRNDVAHSGQFRKKYSKKNLADLIFYNKLGLQILLLRELGYDNLIESQKDNWKTIIKIDELLIKTPST